MSRLKDFFDARVYVQISPQRLTVRNLRNGVVVSDVPLVAVGGAPKLKVLAVGAEANTVHGAPNLAVSNPFAHPRTLISDFTMAEQVIKAFVRRAVGKPWLLPAPVMVIHPQGNPDGGFTQVEKRALTELGLAIGARSVILWFGHDLSDDEIMRCA